MTSAGYVLPKSKIPNTVRPEPPNDSNIATRGRINRQVFAWVLLIIGVLVTAVGVDLYLTADAVAQAVAAQRRTNTAEDTWTEMRNTRRGAIEYIFERPARERFSSTTPQTSTKELVADGNALAILFVAVGLLSGLSGFWLRITAVGQKNLRK
jgi:hypothetical protein